MAEDGTGEPYEKQHQQQQLHTVHRELHGEVMMPLLLLLVLMSASLYWWIRNQNQSPL